MPTLNPIYGARETLLGSILRQKKASNQGGIQGLLSDSAFSKIFSQVANAPKRRRAIINPAEMAIADRFESSASLRRIASQNAELGALRQNTADAAMSGARDIVGRMNELSAMATNPLLNSGDRQSLNAEAQQLKEELSNMQNNAKFNGQPVLQGSSTSTFTGDGSVTMTDADLTGVNADIAGIDLSTQAGANAALTALNTASSNLSTERVRAGANANSLTRMSDMATVEANNLDQSAAVIRENSLGMIGSLFGPQLAGEVNALLGINF